MVVRMMLVHVAVELIEPLLAWHPAFRRADVTQAPLADEGRLVTRLLQRLRHRDILRLQRLRRRVGITGVAAHPRVPMMQTRHEDTARWGAHRRT